MEALNPFYSYNRAGESFFEPSGSEDTSAAEPASVLTVFVVDTSAQLTIFDK